MSRHILGLSSRMTFEKQVALILNQVGIPVSHTCPESADLGQIHQQVEITFEQTYDDVALVATHSGMSKAQENQLMQQALCAGYQPAHTVCFEAANAAHQGQQLNVTFHFMAKQYEPELVREPVLETELQHN